VPHHTHSRCDGEHMELELGRFRQECPGAALALYVVGAAMCACLREGEAALRVRCRTDVLPRASSIITKNTALNAAVRGHRPVDLQTSAASKNKRMKQLGGRYRRAEESGTGALRGLPRMRCQESLIGDIQ
jgi:hypothetical protein